MPLLHRGSSFARGNVGAGRLSTEGQNMEHIAHQAQCHARYTLQGGESLGTARGRGYHGHCAVSGPLNLTRRPRLGRGVPRGSLPRGSLPRPARGTALRRVETAARCLPNASSPGQDTKTAQRTVSSRTDGYPSLTLQSPPLPLP